MKSTTKGVLLAALQGAMPLLYSIQSGSVTWSYRHAMFNAGRRHRDVFKTAEHSVTGYLESTQMGVIIDFMRESFNHDYVMDVLCPDFIVYLRCDGTTAYGKKPPTSSTV
jgi:hypothetical protein